MYERRIKQILDRIISGGLLLLLWPLLLLIGALIKLEDGGKVLFTQYRLGRDRVPFKIYKFRTMKENHKAPDKRAHRGDDRITRVGAVLRKTSLDELPQLFNILKGDMSIIGPRPILPEEAQLPEGGFPYEKRFSCLPGLCCTVDIKYRATADRKLQFTMDAAYAEDIKFTEDILIAMRAAKTVLTGKNIYPE
ncbi:MAG TPA: sugar transferase [Clostridiales bacterium]|nr:sugar transferase [Clostridiales bacterium]